MPRYTQVILRVGIIGRFGEIVSQGSCHRLGDFHINDFTHMPLVFTTPLTSPHSKGYYIR